MTVKTFALLVLGVCAGIAADRLVAVAESNPQLPIMTRKILQRVDVPDSKYEVVLGIAEIAPGVASIGRHTHAGVEAGVLVEGETILAVDGAPDLTLKPGDSYQVPAGVPHDARTGATAGKVVAVYVVAKGQPLATPAP